MAIRCNCLLPTGKKDNTVTVIGCSDSPSLRQRSPASPSQILLHLATTKKYFIGRTENNRLWSTRLKRVADDCVLNVGWNFSKKGNVE
jgi:hypothetical protein